MQQKTREILRQGAEKLGIVLNEKLLGQVETYLQELDEQGRHTNLTRITQEEEAAVKHFLDSWTCCPFIEIGGSLVDVGAGAGFPGLAIKIVRPELDVTLLEATAKKTAFLERVVETLGLGGVKVSNTRAEEAGRADSRETYDYATARAVGSLALVSELCLPLLKVGGKLLAQRGQAGMREAQAAETGLKQLEGNLQQVVSVKPHTGADNYLLVIEKNRITPEKYPRRNDMIQKQPLWS